MKKFILIAMLLSVFSFTRAIQIPETENYILNENSQQVLNTQGVNDPIRDGAFRIVDSNGAGAWSGELIGILWPNSEITNHTSAQNQTLQLVKNIINYVLGFLALVALVYLIYNGVLILTAGWDDAQYKKGIKSLQYALIAIVWVGASWLMVSLIFRLLNLIITP